MVEIKTGSRTHTIQMKDIPHYDGVGLSQQDMVKLKKVMDVFKSMSATALEGITTVDYVANHLRPDLVLNDDSVIEEVKRIKGTKFTDDQLLVYLEILKQHQFLS